MRMLSRGISGGGSKSALRLGGGLSCVYSIMLERNIECMHSVGVNE